MNTENKEIEQVEVLPPEITEVVKREGLNEQNGKGAIAKFAPFHSQITNALETSKGVTDGENPSHQKVARACRLELRRVRCDIEKTRKETKESALKYGRAVDGLANVLKFLCEPEEKRLEDIEKHVERMEAERKAALAEERMAALVAVEADPNAYNLADMNEEAWVMVLAGATKQRNDRIEAERKAEAERIAKEKAEREEQGRIRAENAKLKAEAEKAEKARKAAEAKAKAERDAIEAVARAERLVAEATLKAEREAKEKAEREAEAIKQVEAARLAKEIADAKAKAEAERVAEEAKAKAPDKQKLMEFASSVLAVGVPDMGTKQGRKVLDEIMDKRKSFVKWIKAQVENI